MDPQNVLDATFTQAQAQAFLTRLDALEQDFLPFLLVLSKVSRKSLLRPDDRTVEAGSDIVTMLTHFPGHFASDLFDDQALQRDLDVVKHLAPIATRLDALQSKIADTLLAARSDVGRTTLAVYGAARAIKNPPEKLAALLDPLRDVYARARTRPAEPAEGPSSKDGGS